MKITRKQLRKIILEAYSDRMDSIYRSRDYKGGSDPYYAGGSQRRHKSHGYWARLVRDMSLEQAREYLEEMVDTGTLEPGDVEYYIAANLSHPEYDPQAEWWNDPDYL